MAFACTSVCDPIKNIIKALVTY